MSRRRRTFPIDGEIRLSVECDGREDHPVERVARVALKPRPDLPEGYAVRIEYVRPADDPEDNDYTMPTRLRGERPHLTRRFVCRCGRDVAIEDAHLVKIALLFHSLGQRHARLRELQ